MSKLWQVKTSMRRNVELTVVVPVRNGVETIGEQLDALLASEWDGSWELVVADNGSRDQSRQIVEHYGARDPRVRLVNATDGVGAAHVGGIPGADCPSYGCALVNAVTHYGPTTSSPALWKCIV